MQNEIEAQFLDINKDEMRQKLKAAGGVCLQPEISMKRTIFDAGPNQFVRVRDEGKKIVMTYKNVENDKDILGTREVNIVVDDYDRAVELMKGTHLRIKAHQETLREIWELGECEICLDTWPWIPSFIEIEGPSADHVWSTAKLLGLDKSKAKFGSVDSTYNHYYGVECNIVNLKTPVITFECDPPSWVDPKILAKIDPIKNNQADKNEIRK